MDFLNATDPATLTASPQRVFKSRCYFCSSTNSCADHLPTAASTAVRTLNIAQTADSKPPTTAPTTPSRTSSICSPLRDGATSLLESSCLTSRRLESKGSENDARGADGRRWIFSRQCTDRRRAEAADAAADAGGLRQGRGHHEPLSGKGIREEGTAGSRAIPLPVPGG